MKKIVNTPKIIKSLRIGFDFDGVIIDHSINKINKAKELGFIIKEEQTPSDRLNNIIDQAYKSQFFKYIYGAGTSVAPIVSGANESLMTLKNFGHSLFIISARHPNNQEIALTWIEKNIPDIFDEQNIRLVEKGINKDKVCKELNIQIYIDDKVSVLNMIKSVNKKILYDPYNIRDDFELEDIRPVSSWQEFSDYLKTLVS